ncbi:MAG TPA: tRNA uracil 4-sulfurtransferase ThiI [Candidatus Binataceae bacterium]|nr:tRNA uracil 4-sulfurtransferase ThiI [Candidatus Binataceae bacterium]
MRCLIGRYHEVALKGRNRWRFVEQAKDNLRAIFADHPLANIRSQGPRLMAELPDDLDDDGVAERARYLFGIQNFSISYSVPLDLEAIKRMAIERAATHPRGSFRVSTKRDNKRFPLNSMEIDREVGAAIAEALNLPVDLHTPSFAVSIEIMPECAWVSSGKITGAGGLPLGVTGRGVAMLSGGIDSPVAAYRMMKRGLRLDFVHFHAHPLVSRASRDKAVELVNILTRYQAHSTLMLVPFGGLQREIVAGTLRPLRVVLYRRFMMRIACELGKRTGASVLVTGESLGQVASQTLENMTVIEKASSLPIFRPLVGMDKNEIIEQARALGTFETSILPDEDCCTLFVPEHPETHAELREVEDAESRFDIARMVSDAVAATEVARAKYP